MNEEADGASVLLVDDMPLKRAFITKFLENWAAEAGLRIVSWNFEDVLALRQPVGSKLTILSVGSASLSEPRIAAAHQVLAAAQPGRPLVVLGDRPDMENIERALRLEISGYIPTSLEAEVAVAALSFILANGSYYPPEALLQMGASPSNGPPHRPRHWPLLPPEAAPESRKPQILTKVERTSIAASPDATPERPGPDATLEVEPCENSGTLTSRQKEVLSCLKRARSNKEIARELSMSEATVKVHVRQVMKKLGALNRTHAAVLAVNLVNAERAAPSNVVASFMQKTTLQRAIRVTSRP